MKATSEYVKAAKLIRAQLKESFPDMKFRVTSEGGRAPSVNIYCGLGCNKEDFKEIRELTSKYQLGEFDGYQDCFIFNNVNKNIPQVSYVMVHSARGFLE